MGDASSRSAWNEADAKRLLAEYGVPVAPEELARDGGEARRAAERLGYPVALKGFGEALIHKTERGAVRLDLEDGEAVCAAAREMTEALGDDLEGLLVQPMVRGRREFIAGLFRDPVFGPVVLFGLGGVAAEVLSDVSLRVAPLTEKDAEAMLSELRSAPLLGPFRGEPAVDRVVLRRVLLGLSRLAGERPDIWEVDLNPLIAGPDGTVCAVDALVVSGGEAPRPETRPTLAPAGLAPLFGPRAVAFIGASAGLGKWGQSLPANLIAGGFRGEVYLVNPRGGSQWGRPVYPSLAEIPGVVDLAVITIPADGVVELIPALREKGVRHGLLISSGFSEVGEEGVQLERRLVRAARGAGVLLLGPNTMGICNPHRNLYLTGAHVRPAPGTTALVSQSGNLGVQLLEFAVCQGLGIRAFCGSGNEAMISVEDLLEAFLVDEQTRTVLLYVESVKDGPRFLDAARRLSRIKPVVVLKGGRTEAGDRAASSHTGALASDHRVFDAASRQAGIVQVSQPQEMLDAAAAFSSLPRPGGRRVAIMTLGGGWGVVASDLCAQAGLEIVPLEPEVRERLDRLLPPYWSRGNPVDLVGERDWELPFRALEELMQWDGCDAVIHLGIFGRRYLLRWLLDSMAEVVSSGLTEEQAALYEAAEASEARYLEHVVRLMERHQKPVIGVDLATGETQKTLYEIPHSPLKAVFFPSPERAVRAMAHLCDYALTHITGDAGKL